MSAWLCQKGTLSLCVDVIKSDDFKEFDTENYATKTAEELIEILADLNTKSLNCRYGESKHHVLQDKEYISLDVTNAQRFKSVGCYTYQTCECPENIEHPLFRALEEWYAAHDEEFEPYWQDCEWDIDNILRVIS